MVSIAVKKGRRIVKYVTWKKKLGFSKNGDIFGVSSPQTLKKTKNFEYETNCFSVSG